MLVTFVVMAAHRYIRCMSGSQGHDCTPMVFGYDGQSVKFGGKVEEGKSKASGPKFS